MKRLALTCFCMLLGFAILLASISWSTEKTLFEREEGQRWETHSREVMLETAQTLSALLDTEAGQRGYILTTRPSFLEPRDAGLTRVDQSIDRLAMLTRDNAAQQARIGELRKITAAMFTGIAETVTLVHAGNQARAIAIVSSGLGKNRMDEARAILATISSGESRLLDIHHAAAVSAMKLNDRETMALEVTGLVLLLAAGLATALALRATGRLQMSKEITASAQRLLLFVDRAPAAIAMFDTKMRYIAVSRRFVADFRLKHETPQSLLGRSHYELFPNTSEQTQAIHRRVMAGETLSAQEDAFPHEDGRIDWVSWEMTPWYQADGSAGGAIFFSELITDRKNEALALAQGEARQRGLLDALPANIALLDAAGHIVMVNEAWRAFGIAGGLSPDDPAINDADYLAACMPAATAGDAAALGALDGLREILAGRRERVELVYPCHAPGGSERWFQFTAVPVTAKTGAVADGAVVMHLDITQRMQTEQSLAENEARLRGLLSTVIEGIILATDDGYIVSANPAATRIFGYANEQELVNQPLTALMPKLEASRHDSYLAHHLTTGDNRVISLPLRQLRGVHKDGSEFPLELSVSSFQSGERRYLTGVMRDITERQKSEAVERHAERLEQLVKVRTRELEETQAQLVQAAKMEALGRLAGGVAHDFNNVLQAVGTSVTLASKRLATDPEATRSALEIAATAVDRGAAVTGRLLAFARRSELVAAPIAPLPMLESVMHLLRHTLGPAVTLQVDAGQDMPAMFADVGQLETVLVNLANNARDALVDGIGTIRLIAAAVSAPGEAPAQLVPGDYVRLSVVDDGIGMPPDVLARVTEAFFTTKPKGQGTGLGVAMARGFAEQSGGALTVESIPGRGTTVSLWLPVAPTDAVEKIPSEDVVLESATTHRPGTAILLVDDEVGLRTVLATLLADQGDIVTEAADAASALALLDAGLAVDVLVTDLAMPGCMDGLDLAREARRRKPGLPVLLATGHPGEAAEANIEQAAGSGPFAVLAKPFSAKTLTARVALLLRG